MTLEDYLANGFTGDVHIVEQEGLKAMCSCGYEEYFPTFDDANVAKEVHSN